MHRLTRDGSNITNLVKKYKKEQDALEEKPRQSREDLKRISEIMKIIQELYNREVVNKWAVRLKGYIQSSERKIRKRPDG